MELKKVIKFLSCICIFFIIIDQGSKAIVENLVNEDIHVISNIFVITKVQNKGMAFGINKQNFANIVLSGIILIVIIKLIINQKENMNYKTIAFLGLIIAGGFGNVIDRIFKGAVFDFIKIGNFPVFNLADCFIVIRLDFICSLFYCFL